MTKKHEIAGFLAQLISLNMTISSCIHFPADDILSFFFVAE
jgi:hypothetical protein